MTTVFIIGAGASFDFGLPLGQDLVNLIREDLTQNLSSPRSDGLIHWAMQSGLSGEYGTAARDVAGGMIAARSIDRFLDSRKDRNLTVLLGKLAIAHCLLAKERSSSLGAYPDTDWHSIQNALLGCNQTWLATIFSYLHEGVRPDKSNEIFSDIAFVTFNYDRCIERYLRLAFMQIMGLSKDNADKIASEIPIIHIYGSLGPINSIKFGADTEYVIEAANNIKTFTEGAVDGALAEAHEILARASKIVCLGFAFDPMNVQALFPRPISDQVEILATCHGVANPEKAFFHTSVGEAPIQWHNSFCFDFCRTLEFRAILPKKKQIMQ